VDLVESLFGKSTLMRLPAPAADHSRAGSAPPVRPIRAEVA
jgi:hypothetical protein